MVSMIFTNVHFNQDLVEMNIAYKNINTWWSSINIFLFAGPISKVASDSSILLDHNINVKSITKLWLLIWIQLLQYKVTLNTRSATPHLRHLHTSGTPRHVPMAPAEAQKIIFFNIDKPIFYRISQMFSRKGLGPEYYSNSYVHYVLSARLVFSPAIGS